MARRVENDCVRDGRRTTLSIFTLTNVVRQNASIGVESSRRIYPLQQPIAMLFYPPPGERLTAMSPRESGLSYTMLRTRPSMRSVGSQIAHCLSESPHFVQRHAPELRDV